jgi:hypothetical protein
MAISPFLRGAFVLLKLPVTKINSNYDPHNLRRFGCPLLALRCHSPLRPMLVNSSANGWTARLKMTGQLHCKWAVNCYAITHIRHMQFSGVFICSSAQAKCNKQPPRHIQRITTAILPLRLDWSIKTACRAWLDILLLQMVKSATSR